MSGEMVEFKITSDLSLLRSQLLEANFSEVKAWLDENLAPYKNMAVTPDSIAVAKSYRASIRKVRDRIDASRKEAKAAALAVYTPFEEKCKELTGMCDEAANAIDVQVKEYEQREADEKIDRVHAAYMEIADEEVQEYLPWGVVHNPRWGNRTYSFEDAVDEVATAVEKTCNDLAAIREMGGEDTAYLLDVYKQTRDITAVIRKSSELKTRREREAQRQKEEDERRARMEEERQAELERLKAALSSAPKPQEVEEDEEEEEDAPEEDEVVTLCFRVTCKKSALPALGEYMRANGIKYSRA